MKPLSLDPSEPTGRPYFLWDEDLTWVDLQRALCGARGENERLRLLGKMLREARDRDVWKLVTPAEVAAALPQLGRRLGRRRGFWEFLIQGWRDDGLLAR